MATSPTMATAPKQATWGYLGSGQPTTWKSWSPPWRPRRAGWLPAYGHAPRSRPLACGSGANDLEILAPGRPTPGRCAAP